MGYTIKDRETGKERWVSDVETEGEIIKTSRGDIYHSRNVDVKNDACFIATAVDSDMETILILRNYRDNVLRQNMIGKGFIKCYYNISPFFASKIKKRANMKKLIKRLLVDKIAGYAKQATCSEKK